MDIERKKKEKRIQLVGGLIGICVAAVALFYFFYAEKAEAEKRMVEIVNYVKVQCSTYTHYNESSESKSLLRAIESARQMSTNIDMETENGGQLSQEFLKGNLQTLWVDGIIVLNAEGKTDCEYSTDESLTDEITEYLQKNIIIDFAGYEERSYSERFTREDGSRIDIAACARKDAPGIVAVYYYINSGDLSRRKLSEEIPDVQNNSWFLYCRFRFSPRMAGSVITSENAGRICVN